MASTNSTDIPSENDDPSLWYIGMMLNMLASLLVTTGMLLQKVVHEKMKRNGDRTPYWTKPLWLLGFLFIVSETILDLVTFGFAPVTILAPLSSVTLVWNVILAPIVLREALGALKLISTVFILSGAILAVAFAQHETPFYDLAEITELLRRPMFIIFETVAIGLLIHLECAFSIIDRHLERLRDIEDIMEEAQDVNSTYSERFLPWKCKAKYYSYIEAAVVWSYTNFIGKFGLVILYAFMTAALSGQAVGTAKLVIELIKSTLMNEGTPFYKSWLWYCLVFYLSVIVVLLTRSLNEVLRRFDALVAIPIYQALCILLQLATAAFLFDEFGDFEAAQVVCFPLGTLLCICGIYSMALAERKQNSAKVSAVTDADTKSSSRNDRLKRCESNPIGNDLNENHKGVDNNDTNEPSSCNLKVADSIENLDAI